MKVLIVFLFACAFVLSGCSNNSLNNNSDNVGDYNSERLAVHEDVAVDDSSRIDTSSSAPVEEPFASFSTKVSQKDPDRQNNITICCSSLNGFVVKAGETFSFCNTLGPASPEDGYEKADTFDADGDTIQAYGGGKCQVSTTLYNAVLQAPNLTVVERHEHSGPVYYVPEGMDACVSYGSCDFKFRNDNDFDVKMYISNTPDSIDVSLVKISS